MKDNEESRRRLDQLGHEALADSELVAVAADVSLDTARALLASAGDLTKLHTVTPLDLQAVPDITYRQALRLRAAFGLACRLQARHSSRSQRVEHPVEVAALMRDELRGREQEEFHVLALDPRHQVLRRERVTIGLADRTQVHPREVFRVAIRYNASRVVLVHNHPSGDPTPSATDIKLTNTLVSAGKLLGIEVVDHVILGTREPGREQDWSSFRELGFIQD